MQVTGGRHFLQIPGPTNVPDRVLRAIAAPTIDHRGPQFAELTKELLARLGPIFGTEGPIVIYPSSGTGAWEAALTNTLDPGDKVLLPETGQFSTLWVQLGKENGLDVEVIPSDWRHPIDAAAVGERLSADTGHAIKAVAIVHNETSTGISSDIPAIRAAIDEAGHPALLMVDTISSLGSMDYQHDEWGVDVSIGGSQKGLMLPPGMAFNAISEKALAASRTATHTRSYFDWAPMLKMNEAGFFPYTPPTNLFYGLREAITMLEEEGLPNVFARHRRHGAAARAAAAAWGLELNCLDEAGYSAALTTVRMPEGHDADALRSLILEKFDMSLGGGLGKIAGKVFRIGHLGHFNDLTLAGTLAGVQMGLQLADVPIKPGGVEAALDVLRAETGDSAA